METRHKPLAVISGGMGFLGSAIARSLRARDWNVVALVRTWGNGAYQCDVSNEVEVASAIGTIAKEHGMIHACIHAATPPMEASAAEHMRVAVDGAKFLTHAAAPHMPEDAAFIGITSTLTTTESVLPNMAPYIAAKKELRNTLRALAGELAAQKVRVYAVAPGFMHGGLNAGIPNAVLDLLAEKSGAGIADVEEVAALVKRLCEDEDAYPSGVSISVPTLVQSAL